MLIKTILNDFAFKNAKRLAGNSLFHSVIVSYCYFSVYSLVFVLIEKIYQTLETVFHRLSKHLEFRQNTPLSVIFQLSSRCLDIPMKHCLACLMYDLFIKARPGEQPFI